MSRVYIYTELPVFLRVTEFREHLALPDAPFPWMAWLVDRLHHSHTVLHTPSIAFRHLPPNYARFSDATKGELFISVQPSTDAVSALRNVWVLIIKDCRSNLAPKHARKHEAHPPLVKKKRVPSRIKRFWFYLSWRKRRGQL